MMKRLVALAVVAVLAVGCLAGCGGKTEVVNTGDNTLSYWCAVPGNAATHMSDLNDMLMYQQREKDTGIHIEFIHPSAASYTEQFNLMIASREFPDMIEYGWSSYAGGPQKAIDDGIILPINDLLDKYAPNLKAMLSENTALSKNHNKGSMTDEGNYIGFPAMNIGDARVFGGPMIRQDWLDELGLKAPVTVDEWTEVLRAFRDKKGAKAPFSATADYFAGNTNSFNGAFGVGKKLYMEGDTVKYGPIEPAYKEFLALMNSWYKEGLLDRDFANNNRTMVDSQIVNGNAGATLNTLGAGMGVYLNQMKDTNPTFNFVGIEYPVKELGMNNYFRLSEADLTGMFTVITTACDTPELAAQWMDFWYSKDGYNLLNFGVEGDTYNMIDGYPTYTDKILNNPEGLSISEALGKVGRAAQAAPGQRQAPEYLDQYYQYEQQKEAYKLWTDGTDKVMATRIPNTLYPSAEESDELAVIQSDMNVYVEEMITKFITGAESLDNYDKFVETLKKTFRVERLIEINQAMYDRYKDR